MTMRADSAPTATNTGVPNPVIPGLHPDPSVCRVGDEYFLACSSFEYFPGVPIFHSPDLARWRQVGNALDRPAQLRLRDAPSSGGVFAPTLRHHDGRFWLVTTNIWDRGHLIVTATDPAGPWSDPVYLTDPTGAPLAGIDPDLVWDEHGTCWLTYSVIGGITQVPLDPHTGVALDEPRRLWSGSGLAHPEAPHLYHVDGLWYLLIAEGGTERGHAVSIARGPSAGGPFTGHPGNPILSHRSTDRAVQNTGHADLVQAADGSWWMVLLGVRPRGGTPAFHPLGRETFLTPVRWVDGWPVPEPIGPPAPAPADERDDFDTSALGPQWISVRERPPHDLTERPGWLRLTATGETLDDRLPAFVGQRQRHHDCRVRARVRAENGCGGLAVRLDERHHFEICLADGEVWARARIGPLTQRLGTLAVGTDPVVLRVETDPGTGSFISIGAPPDRVRLGVERGESVVWLADLDGRYLSTEVTGGFTGRVIGIYAERGTIDVDWFEYQAR